VSFLLIPLWARFLTPEDYGITGTLLAYSGVLSTVLEWACMGLLCATITTTRTARAKRRAT